MLQTLVLPAHLEVPPLLFSQSLLLEELLSLLVQQLFLVLPHLRYLALLVLSLLLRVPLLHPLLLI